MAFVLDPVFGAAASFCVAILGAVWRGEGAHLRQVR